MTGRGTGSTGGLGTTSSEEWLRAKSEATGWGERPRRGPWEVTGAERRTDVLGFHLESQPRTGGAIEGPREQRIETQRSGEGWWPQQPPKPEVHRVLCVYGDSPGRPMTDVKHHPIVMG